MTFLHHHRLNCCLNAATVLLWLGFTVCTVAQELPVPRWLLVLDSAGGVQGIDIESGTGPVLVRVPDPIAPRAERLIPTGSDGYILVQSGGLLPLASAPLPPARWSPDEVIVDGKYDAIRDGLWLLTESGGLYFQHGNERVPFPLDVPQDRTWRRLDYDPFTQRLLVLDDLGDIFVMRDNQIIYDAHAEAAVAASLIPGTSAVAVVRVDGLLLYGDTAQEELTTARIITATPVVDMEILPDHRVFVLDAYGRIRDDRDQPVIAAEGIQLPFARDLAFGTFEDIPQWLPPAWNTRFELEPSSLVIMPGPNPGARQLSSLGTGRDNEDAVDDAEDGVIALRIRNAEELGAWIAELHFDPSRIVITENDVEAGSWWRDAAPGAQVSASVNAEQGVLSLQGGSAAQPGFGATGGGILSRIRLRPRGEEYSISRVELIQASVNHTAMSFLFRPLGEPLGVTVTVSARPRWMDLAWQLDGRPQDLPVLEAGGSELVESVVLLEEGSSLRRLEVTFAYEPDILRPVVAYPGTAWTGYGKLNFQETERPGGQLKTTIRAVDSKMDRVSGEVLVVLWRTRDFSSMSDVNRKAIRIEGARAFSSSTVRGTRLRIDTTPLELAAPQDRSSQ